MNVKNMREGVSVVIPCYNAAKYIRETLDSVFAQQYDGPLEVLVADDGSMDGSQEIIASCGSTVRLLPRPEDRQRSAAAARNRCLEVATQPLVAFLDADDLWLPGHLAALADAMGKRPEVGLAYDDGYCTTDGSCKLGAVSSEPHRSSTTPDDLLLGQHFPPAAVMVRRNVFQRVGVFDESLPHAEDHDMWLRIVELFPAAHVPEYGFMYRIHANQKSLKSTLWPTAAIVFEKARKRYPYCRRSIRKRRAVLAYRFSETAFSQRQILRGVVFLAAAGLLDPLRAVAQIYSELSWVFRRRQPTTGFSEVGSTNGKLPSNWPRSTTHQSPSTSSRHEMTESGEIVKNASLPIQD